MAEGDIRVPLVVHALVMAGALAVLSWDAVLVGRAEAAVQAIGRTQARSLSEMFQEGSEAGQAGRAAARAKARAKWHFRFATLLFLAFPTAVIFPTILSSRESESPRRRRVVSIQEMTFDDVGKDFGGPSPGATPRKRLFTINLSALGLSALAMVVCGLIWPDLFGGLRNLSLLALACSMAFVASVLAYPLRERVQETRQVGVILGAGYLIVAGLAWLFG